MNNQTEANIPTMLGVKETAETFGISAIMHVSLHSRVRSRLSVSDVVKYLSMLKVWRTSSTAAI